MSKLYLMCGAPGSGKSYWATKHLTNKDKYISRDEVRFSFLQDGDDYFAKENEVFKEFIRQINENLEKGYNVFADATHLNFNSRNKTLCSIAATVEEVNVIYLDTPLEVCIERNSHRTGRKFVPETVIRNMYKSIKLPEKEEGINKIYIVKDNEPIKIIELM